MKKLITLMVGLLIAVSSNAQIQRPKLVVGLVVDQMMHTALVVYADYSTRASPLRILI